MLQMFVPAGAAFGPVTWSPFIADVGKMWSVGLAGLIAVLAVDHSIRDLGLRCCRPRYFMIAAALPLAYCLAIYVPVWIFGVGGFRGVGYFITRLLLVPLRLPLNLLFAAGEEIGWRGVLVPNLMRTSGFGVAAFLPGVIWAVWHYPDILLFGYNAGTPIVYAISCFSISLIGLGVFLSWLRLVSNSVWPPILFHGVHNTLIWGVFDRATETGRFTAYITTEFGAGMTAAAVIIGYVCWANRPSAASGIASSL
jgi:membrane protease YdiL (CAAX protease family)